MIYEYMIDIFLKKFTSSIKIQIKMPGWIEKKKSTTQLQLLNIMETFEYGQSMESFQI